MKRDSIFFRLFQQSPTLLFELLPDAPENADRYRFDSVAVKEPKFEIDGVFLPPDDKPGVVYYGEVQFQRDDRLYERLVSESSNHFFRNREKFSDWQAVVIYPSRQTEQKDIHPYRALINSDQFHRIYLNDLGNARELPIGLALLALTIEKPKKAKETARYLADRTRKEIRDPQANRAIMEMLTMIVVYTFNNLSRVEVEKMLGLDITFQETRFYKDVKAEERRSIVSILLDRKLGKLPEKTKKSIEALDLVKLQSLAIALLDFRTIADLEAWLKQN
jgi:predicted transposase/invertase (TIGR01784 family)